MKVLNFWQKIAVWGSCTITEEYNTLPTLLGKQNQNHRRYLVANSEPKLLSIKNN